MTHTRQEHDSLGPVDVPASALYGPQTARAVDNFPISGWPMPREMIAAMGLVKLAACTVHKQAGRLPADKADAIIQASREVLEGRWDEEFPVDTFQTGSGTSTNMNANEVIANRAAVLLGGQPGDKSRVHPNDDVNLAQSSNDVFPTAMHVASATAIHHQLVPELRKLRDTLEAKQAELDSVVKIARTHLQDAVPIRMGQVFSGYTAKIDHKLGMIGSAVGWLCELPIGGSAVGTGLNVPEGFGSAVCEIIAEKVSLPFRPASNYFEATAARDAAVFASATLRGVALSLGKIASDIRLMASGPRCGLGELEIPAVQPGSSIMPGKVNPVLCESVVQVACQVVGCDAAIAAGATGGVGSILDLNVAMPMIASNLLTSTRLLANVTEVFERKCLRDLRANARRCERMVEDSLAMVTALTPEIGYDAACQIARQAWQEGKTIRQVCSEKDVVTREHLDELLEPRRQTGQ